ncbi:MAG: hypothetical protein EXS35_06320 [Pedosphaera sp.]|nr:hypothetical protein [Pedosphaera sp.]
MQKKTLETFLYSLGGVAAMAVILVAANVIFGSVHRRVDLTKEKAFTLSDGTRAILAKLDTPVKIRFYCSQSAGAAAETVYLKDYARKVEDLLAEYKQAAKGRIIIEKYDPQPDSDAEDSAKLDGVEGAPLQSGDRFYMGLAVSMIDTKEAIPFLQPVRERLLEYDISRAITRVVRPEKPVVGVMSSLPVFGMQSNPMMQQMGQRGQPAWAFVTELRNDFNVKNVGMDVDKIDDDVKVLVVIHPKEISDKAQFAIDQFVLRGGKLVAFLDSVSLIDSRGQNPMMGQMGGGGSSLDKLLKAWGLQFENSKVVADARLRMEVGGGDARGQQRPVWLSLTPENMDTNDVVTSQIDNVWFFAGGAFSGTPADGLKQTVLLKSSPASALVDGFLANLSPEAAMKDFKPSGKEFALAVRLAGKFKTAFPDGKPAEKPEEKKEGETKPEEKKADTSLKQSAGETAVVLIGDSDMIHDNFSIQETQTPFGPMRRQLNANINFAQNAIEQLAGDNNLITVRSRATLNRPFTRVKQMEAAAEERFRDKLNEVRTAFEDAQRRVAELGQSKDGSQRFIKPPEQQKEEEEWKKKAARFGVELKQVQKDLRREVVQLENHVKWWNIFAMPLAVTACGILLAVYKRKLTAAK